MSGRKEAERVRVASGSATAPRLRWVLVVGLLVANLVLFLLGVLAAVAGGGLSDWGDGAGGLDGWPNDLMAFFSYPIGLAAAIATFRERRVVLVSVAVFATGLLISTGFLEVGHLLDPCARGWWDDSSTVGDEPLCSIQGEIAVRFHLLLHGASGLLAATVAAVIYRRARLFEWWPPEGRPSLEQ